MKKGLDDLWMFKSDSHFSGDKISMDQFSIKFWFDIHFENKSYAFIKLNLSIWQPNFTDHINPECFIVAVLIEIFNLDI